MNRFAWVDIAKGVGIILVVLGHVNRGVYKSGISINESTYHLIDNFIYSFHMPLFFFLSGLFIQSSIQKRGNTYFILSKFDTILYPFILWSLLQGSIEVFLSKYTNGTVAMTEVLSLWQPRAQFWFLYALFSIFVISGLLLYKNTNKGLYLLLSISTLLFFFHQTLTENGIVHMISNNLIYFALGALFIKLDKNTLIFHNKFVFASISIVFVIFQYLVQFNILENSLIISFMLACLSIFFIIFIVKNCTFYAGVIFSYLGKNSMSIFLMHILAGSGARVALNLLGVDVYFYHIIIGCLAGICLPLIANFIIQRFNIPYLYSVPFSKIWIK